MVKSVNERAVRSLTTFYRNTDVFPYRGSAKSRGTFSKHKQVLTFTRSVYIYRPYTRGYFYDFVQPETETDLESSISDMKDILFQNLNILTLNQQKNVEIKHPSRSLERHHFFI